MPEQLPSHRDAVAVVTEEDQLSIQRQLAEARENLRLIRERQTEFVLSTDIPLQLVKDERRWLDRIAELEQQLAEPTVPGGPSLHRDDIESVPEQLQKTRPAKAWLPQVWWVPIVVALIGLVGVLTSTFAEQAKKTPIPQLEPESISTPTATVVVSTLPTGELELVSEPTPTATSPPALTLNCLAAAEPFSENWVTVRHTIGCASGSLVTGLIAEEGFQRGKMFWREPFDYSQAVVMFSDGTWQIFKHYPYDDTRESEFSCVDENTPAQCPPTPKRGFGMLWCDIPAIRDRLGNAIDCERGYQGSMQQFEKGFMLQSDDGWMYLFYGYESGRWERR